MKGKARSRQVRLTVCALALIVLLSLVAGCGGSAAGGDALTYNFTAGDSFTYDLKAVLNGNLNAPGMAEDEGQIPQDSTLEARFTMKVTDVTDEVATITYSYEKMSMTSEGKTEEMDLGSVPEVTAKVDKHGKIVSVEGADSGILGSFLGTNASSSPIDPSQISGTSMVPFPTDAVEVGDAQLPEAQDSPSRSGSGQIDILLDTTLAVTVRLGQAEIEVRQLLQLGPR